MREKPQQPKPTAVRSALGLFASDEIGVPPALA
jgi:hypothetical protein